MQVTSHAEHIHDDHGHDHDHDHEHGHTHDHGSPVRWLFLGTSVMLAALFYRWLFPENTAVGEVAMAVGSIILAMPIFKTAIQDLLHGHMHMDELIALGVMAAMVDQKFEAAGIISFFMLLAHLIESRTAKGAHKAIETLIRLTPASAHRITSEGEEEEVAVGDLREGDRLRVYPGDSVPADGTIESGQTTINEATITGESVPCDKGVGNEVFAGTQNLTGVMELTVSKVGQDTTLGRVKELILAAERTRLPIMKIVDRYAGFYTPVIIMIAAIVWFFTDDWTRVIALLIMGCPCAIILATPTAMVAALSAAARNGVLFKNVVDLESASRIDAIVFDKTGTLTNGELGVVKLQPKQGCSPSELLLAGASAERYSKHPAAQALLTIAKEAEVNLIEPQDFVEEAGKGVSAMVDGAEVLAGRLSWLNERGVFVSDEDAKESEGLSVIHVSKNGLYLGWVGLRDQVRTTTRQTMDELRRMNIRKMAMVTGDRTSVAERVAAELGGCDVKAECLPQEKAAYVKDVQQQGFNVAFVGDGVNDAPALASSNTGIAMGAAGSDIAIHSAKVALMSNDLLRVPFLIRLSRAAKSVIYQNLAIGGLFILLGFMLIALGRLDGIMAAILHNAGSLFIVFNSARLVRFGEDTLEDEEDPFSLSMQAPASVSE